MSIIMHSLISDCPAFDESVPSAPLFIKTPKDPSGADEDGVNYSDDEFDNDEPPRGVTKTNQDDASIILKIVNVSSTNISMDWSAFLDREGVVGYKVQWNTEKQPWMREALVGSDCFRYTLKNCVPGMTHYVRIIALSDEDFIIAQSKVST